MIFRKVILFFCCVCICTNAYCQNSDVIIKFCPLALADVVNFPAIQAGVEFKLSERISWYNEVGFKYSDGIINQTDSNFIASNGFKLKSEIRYHFRNNGKHHFSAPGYYFAANVFAIQSHYNTEVGYTANNVDYRDAFGVKKNVYGMNALAGRQFPIYKKLLLDIYMGIGFRYRIVNTVGEDYNEYSDKLMTSTDLNISSIKADIDARPGNSIAPNFTAGIRLCFKL